MTEKDWEDEAIEIVNERFGDDPGYSVTDEMERAARSARRLTDALAANKAKIIMEDGTEFDIDDQGQLSNPKLEDLEWQRIAFGSIEIEWTEVDAEVFDRMFADMQAEQEQLEKIERFVFMLRDIIMVTIFPLVVAMVLLGRRASKLIRNENDE